MFTILNNLKTERQYLSSTGFTKEEFIQLLLSYESCREQYNESKKKSPSEKKLSTAESELFFILFYFKTYPTYDVLGLCFGMQESAAKKNIKRILPILNKTLESQSVLPLRLDSDPEEIILVLQQLEDVLVDVTERTVNRPSDDAAQKKSTQVKRKNIP